ncbi:MAG: hypothetical protein WD054_00435 [Gemmatimonadota bacterium]
MAGKLSASAQVRLATLGEFTSRVQHVYGMVEVYAASKTKSEQQLQPMARAFGRLKLQFMGAGLDPLSQLCGAMEIAAKRGLSPAVKARILREGVGSLKFQLELEQRSVLSDEEAMLRKKEGAEEGR